MSNQPDVRHGFHIFRDGNAWCAVGPHFIDMMKSDIGFGETIGEAHLALKRVAEKSVWWRDKTFPPLERFTVHGKDATS